MNIKHTKLTNKIHLLTFETQQDITSTFLRFQEHYESPNFRGKIFSFDEFKQWYIKTSPNGKISGKFTYYSDWNGFNIPSHVLKPFYDGKFNPLSEQESKLLDIFKDEVGAFYIIGVHSGTKKIDQLLNHEIAHGLFYTSDNYKADVLRILSQFDVSAIKEELRSKAGYHEKVLNDEVHAYSIDSVSNLKTPIPESLSSKLKKSYEKHLKKNINKQTLYLYFTNQN
ncbi:ABC transporter ATP-binding protein [Candidatus Parcubacteria bacterium]|nr:ABC transporter ATP-binding protein [Candidatus Parcubacteria bacterium]